MNRVQHPETVLVVGGGAVGLAVAYHLLKRGLHATVIDSGDVGGSTSWGNAGWLSPVLTMPTPGPGMPVMGVRDTIRADTAVSVRPDKSLSALRWMLQFARHCTTRDFRSGCESLAILTTRMLDGFDELSDAGLQFGMRTSGNLRACLTEREARHQLDELSIMRDVGLDVPTEILDAGEMHALEPSLTDRVRAGFMLASERHVDPVAFTRALGDQVLKLGGRIHEHVHVTGLRTARGQISAVQTADEVLTADAVVIAAGMATRDLCAQLGIPVPMQSGKGYSFLIPMKDPPRSPVYLSHTKVAVTHFDRGVRVAGALEVGDERLNVNDRIIRGMISVARRFIEGIPSELDDLTVRERRFELWAGRRPMTPDGLPVIGKLPGLANGYVATGHGMTGVGLAPITGELLSGLIADSSNGESLVPFALERFL